MREIVKELKFILKKLQVETQQNTDHSTIMDILEARYELIHIIDLLEGTLIE